MVDSNNIQQQIQERLEQLPTNVQEAILSAEFDQKIQFIGSSAKLHIDQLQRLSDLTMLVMLGFREMNDFKGLLQDQVGISAETAEKIANDVNQQVFLSIRESMKKFAEGQGTPASQAVPTAGTTSKPPLAAVLPKAPVQSPATASAPQVPVTFDEPELPPPPATPPTPAAPKVDMHPADVMLTQKTVSMPQNAPAAPTMPPAGAPKPIENKTTPPKPADYKADPYREPIN